MKAAKNRGPCYFVERLRLRRRGFLVLSSAMAAHVLLHGVEFLLLVRRQDPFDLRDRALVDLLRNPCGADAQSRFGQSK